MNAKMKVCPICNTNYDLGNSCPEDGATLVHERRTDPLIGTNIKDMYRLDSLLGEGGMSRVYLATQLTLNRQVAIKIVHSDMNQTSDFIQLFLREARIASQINHPNVISIFDFGNTAEGLAYLVMEYLPGRPLNEWLGEEKGLTKLGIMAMMKQICSAMGAAHQSGIVHRDLKPANIVIAKLSDNTKVAKILDFGIGKPLFEQDSDYTRAGMVMGTPGYLSPEQICGGGDIDIRADIYSLGALLYFLICGRKPFSGQTQQIIMHKQTSEQPDPIDSQTVRDPSALCFQPVVKKAMSLQREHRYPTAKDFFNDVLRHAKSGLPEPEMIEDESTVLAPPGHLLAVGSAIPESHHDKDLPGQVPPAEALSSDSECLRPVSTVSKFKRVMGAFVGLTIVCAAVIYLVPEWREQVKDSWSDMLYAAAPQRGIYKDRVVVGMSAPFRGPAKEIGRSMRIGIETRINEINDAGGIHGRNIELRALDDEYNPQKTQEIIKQFINKKTGAFAMLGNVGTANARAILPDVLDHKIVLFGAFSGGTVLRNDPPDRYVFNYRASYAQETAAIVKFLVDIKKVNPQRIAVFTQQDDHGSDALDGVQRALRQYGIEASEIIKAEYRRNSSQVDGAVASILKHRKRIDAVVMVGTPTASALFTIKLRKANFEPLLASISFVGSRALAENFQALGAEFGEGVLITQVVPVFTSYATGVLSYRDALQKYFPSEEANFVSLEGYIAATIFFDGFTRAGRQVTTEKLVDALQSINNYDIGIGDNISFGPSDHQAVDRVWMTQLDARGSITVLK